MLLTLTTSGPVMNKYEVSLKSTKNKSQKQETKQENESKINSNTIPAVLIRF